MQLLYNYEHIALQTALHNLHFFIIEFLSFSMLVYSKRHIDCTMKQFVCVEWSQGTNSIVWHRWMLGEDCCMWPPSGDIELVRSKTIPKKNWKQYSCTILCESSKFHNLYSAAYRSLQFQLYSVKHIPSLLSRAVTCLVQETWFDC